MADPVKYSEAAYGDVGTALIINDISDVNITSVVDNQVLAYDAGTGKWVNTGSSAVTTLGALTDVDVTAKTNGSILQYDSSTDKFVARNEVNENTGTLTLNGGAF